jgi:hypothetical protein
MQPIEIKYYFKYICSLIGFIVRISFLNHYQQLKQMLKHITLIALLGTILSFSIAGYTQELKPEVQKAVKELKQRFGTNWIIEKNEQGIGGIGGIGVRGVEKDYEHRGGNRQLSASRLLYW